MPCRGVEGESSTDARRCLFQDGDTITARRGRKSRRAARSSKAKDGVPTDLSEDVSRASSLDFEDNLATNGNSELENDGDDDVGDCEGDEDEDTMSLAKRKTSKRAAHLATKQRLSATVRQLNAEDDHFFSLRYNSSSNGASEKAGKKKGRPKKVPDPDTSATVATIDPSRGLDRLHETTVKYIEGRNRTIMRYCLSTFV